MNSHLRVFRVLILLFRNSTYAQKQTSICNNYAISVSINFNAGDFFIFAIHAVNGEVGS